MAETTYIRVEEIVKELDISEASACLNSPIKNGERFKLRKAGVSVHLQPTMTK